VIENAHFRNLSKENFAKSTPNASYTGTIFLTTKKTFMIKIGLLMHIISKFDCGGN